MYVFGGVGTVWSSDAAALRDQLQKVENTGAYWEGLPSAPVRELQKMLNARLARFNEAIPEDGKLSWPICAAIDRLYGGGSAYVASDSVQATLKRMARCPWESGGGGTLVFEYPRGTSDRDYVQSTDVEPEPARRVAPSTTSGPLYCKPRAGMCFDGQGEKDTAQTQCQYGYKPNRGTDACIIQQRFDYRNQHQYDPCAIKDYPVCGASAAQVRQELLAEQAQPVAPPEEDAEISAPVGGGGILEYSHLYWGQGPDAEVTELIHSHLNPALRRMGYRQIGENQRLNMQVCAAIKRTHPSEFSAFGGCQHKPIPNPDQYLSRPSPTGQEDLPEPVNFGDNPTSVFAPTVQAPVQTIYSDAEPLPTIYTDEEPFVPAQSEPESEPEERSMAIYGILAAVVIGGGVVYLTTRKKKKRR